MCTCASCKVTDQLADAGFASWPRGNPAGRVSAADYSAHVTYSKQWGRAPCGTVSDGPAIPRFKVGGPAVFPAWMNGNGPIEPAPKWLHDWINARGPIWKELGNALPGPDRVPTKADQKRAASVQRMARLRARSVDSPETAAAAPAVRPAPDRKPAAPVSGPSIVELLERAIALRAA